VISVQVLGVEATIARLAALAAASEKAVDAGAEVGAQAVLNVAEATVPVDTGTLRDSLHVDQDTDGVLVGSDVPYAVFVEYGTSDTPSQPFLRPALDSASEETVTAVDAALQAAIRGVAL